MFMIYNISWVSLKVHAYSPIPNSRFAACCSAFLYKFGVTRPFTQMVDNSKATNPNWYEALGVYMYIHSYIMYLHTLVAIISYKNI